MPRKKDGLVLVGPLFKRREDYHGATFVFVVLPEFSKKFALV